MPFRTFGCLIVLLALILGAGCFGASRPDPSVPAPAPPQSGAPVAAPAPPQTPTDNNTPAVPVARLPDVVHPRQKILAVLRNGSDICVIDGREIKMDGPAIIRRFEVKAPLNSLALALGISADNIFIYGNKVTVRAGEKTVTDITRADERGVVYADWKSIGLRLGYDILRDPIFGRAEILDCLPRTAADLQIGAFSLDMTLGDVQKIMGTPKHQIDGYALYYPELSAYGHLGQLYYLSVYSDKYPTPRGLRVGDSLDKVFALYGRGYFRSIGWREPDIFHYYPTDTGDKNARKGYISFEVDHNNLVKEIVLFNGPEPFHYSISR